MYRGRIVVRTGTYSIPLLPIFITMLKRTMQIRRNLTEGSIVKNIWHLALPTIATSALWDLFNIVDMIFVGKLGPPAIAAVSMCGIMMGIIFTIAIGITTGSVALIARFFGANDYENADKVVISLPKN